MEFYSCDLSDLYAFMSMKYADLKDKEKTLDALRNYLKFSIINATLPDKMDYTAPLVNHMKYKVTNTSKNCKGNSCNGLIDDLKNPAFDFICENDDFTSITSTLEKYAEQI